MASASLRDGSTLLKKKVQTLVRVLVRVPADKHGQRADAS
jgi:hypothetical protein